MVVGLWVIEVVEEFYVFSDGVDVVVEEFVFVD